MTELNWVHRLQDRVDLAWRKFVEWMVLTIVRLIPDYIKYRTAIDVVVHATTGKYGNTVVPELGAMEAIARFDRDRLRSPLKAWMMYADDDRPADPVEDPTRCRICGTATVALMVDCPNCGAAYDHRSLTEPPVTITLWLNGLVMAFDTRGEQMCHLQGAAKDLRRKLDGIDLSRTTFLTDSRHRGWILATKDVFFEALENAPALNADREHLPNFVHPEEHP